MKGVNFKHPPANAQDAADWWLARDSLGLRTQGEATAFAAWLRNPENASAYAQAQARLREATTYAADPDILEMRAAALKVWPIQDVRRPYGMMVAAVLIVAVLAVPLLMFRPNLLTNNLENGISSATSKRYETGIGENRVVKLDDGSEVSLNTGSLVEVSYNARRRDVYLLRGEAYFKVAHNRRWPFVVTAGDRRVTAVGTAFDVRIDGPSVKVVLVEGKVRVDPMNRTGLSTIIPQLAEKRLTAGEQLLAQEGDAHGQIATTDTQRAVSWQTNQLIFRDDTLTSAITELNRYSTTQILIRDPRIGDLKVSGVFSTNRPGNFIAAVTTFYPIVAKQASPGVTELAWREPE